LINLIGNAIKFTDTGHVYVTVSLEKESGQSYVRFDVEDTGIGIARKKQGKIFNSFTQADGHTTRKYGGTGLGLTITKQLSELLGGGISLVSEEGKGSNFSLRIPTGVESTRQPLSDRDRSSGYNNAGDGNADKPEFSGNVLVAEDDPTNQMLIKLLLERVGLDVTIVSDGKEAVKEALSQEFDMIIMDIHMPKMNGNEATMALKEKGITIPILALTANAIKDEEKEHLCAMYDEYLLKPIDNRELLKTIGKYLPAKEPALTGEQESSS
jgi:CheY-like chemotaxis protein